MKSVIDITKKTISINEESKQWPQVLALLTASLCGFSCGTLFAWTSPAIPKLLSNEYNFDIETVSYLTVIPPIAMILSSPLYCMLLNKIGRKYTLLSCTIIHVTAWILIAFGTQIYVFYVSRILAGMGDACTFSALPIYIAEVSTPDVRGIWGNSMIFMIFLGQLLINVVGYYCTIKVTAFVMLIFPIIFCITFSLLPETPYYCIMKGKEEAAIDSLHRLRRMKNVEEEFRQLTFDVQRQMSEPGTFKDLYNIESNRKALLIANLARIIQQFGGISCLIVYSQYIFLQTGGNISSGHSAIIFSGMFAGLNLIANVVSDKLGRTKSMVISCCCSGIALLGEAVYFFLKQNSEFDLSYVSWFPLLGLVTYVVVFSIGLATVPSLLLGELFSAKVRGKASLVTNVVFGIVICVATKVFQLLMSNFGMWVPFLCFAICCFLGAIGSFYIIPDTKGKTLEEIQQMLKTNKKK